MEARKDNKVITISESEKSYYIGLGFDIYQNGKKVDDGLGKTVPYEKYNAVVEELEALKAAKAKEAKETKAK